MVFMVIERFKPGAIHSIYERVKQQGRILPAGLDYINSWLSEELTICYQLMSTEDDSLFEEDMFEPPESDELRECIMVTDQRRPDAHPQGII